MKSNMGLPDRIIRVIFATIAPVLYFADIINGVLALLLGITSILLVTSFFSFCPFYFLLRINTK